MTAHRALAHRALAHRAVAHLSPTPKTADALFKNEMLCTKPGFRGFEHEPLAKRHK
jgi:hypothetical protein